MRELEETTLDSVSTPTLVCFSATWCGPCQRFKPTLSSFSESADDVDVVYVDIDSHRDLVDRFGVMTVPTVVALSSGNEEVGRFNGGRSSADLEDFVNKTLRN